MVGFSGILDASWVEYRKMMKERKKIVSRFRET